MPNPTPVNPYKHGHEKSEFYCPRCERQEIWEQGLQASDLRHELLRLATESLCQKLRVIEPLLDGVFVLNAAHGFKYAGPNWELELKDAEEAARSLRGKE